MKFDTDKSGSRYGLAKVEFSWNETRFEINWFQTKLGKNKTRYFLNDNIDLLAFVLIMIDSSSIFMELHIRVDARFTALRRSKGHIVVLVVRGNEQILITGKKWTVTILDSNAILRGYRHVIIKDYELVNLEMTFGHMPSLPPPLGKGSIRPSHKICEMTH